MKNIDPILVRVQVHLCASTRKEMREIWGISKGTLDTWVNRDKIPVQRLATFAEKEGLNLDWLLGGTGEKFKVTTVNAI